ncbi:MAG TPA: M28 family peptidase [Caulobacteraceae bacterium]|jgi:Zn-dependent M28 family amino/carboxypeptidase|nr:M28 family peptidase [Caulobacteraceae bacterium]
MTRLSPCLALAATLAATGAAAIAAPTFRDADTRAWWALTTQLSNDSMEGRDTGSPAYARAARIVADRFKAAGLQPAGDRGGWFQSVPLHEVRVDSADLTIAGGDGTRTRLTFLHAFTVRPTDDLAPALDAPLVFRGYCSAKEMDDIRGKAVVCFGARRQGLPSGGERFKAAVDGGAAALINIDDTGFTLEPARWPSAYARSVTIKGTSAPPASSMPVISLSAPAFIAAAGPDRDPARILADGAAKRSLPSFDFSKRITARFAISKRDYTSDNVLGLLPGADPSLKPQVVVISAHLDGYGYGEPINGDRIYHGTFDDAAYVATLVRFADKHHGKGLKRSVLVAAFTGEEKGLLGSTWFVRHPTVPREDLVADINLDQLRPLFPLKILTIEGLDETTLGRTAAEIARRRGVEPRKDMEPERNLLHRADNWPFLESGIPSVGFVFGYDPGTKSERIYRAWYKDRYHHPMDSLATPFDPIAARDFNRFFYDLTETVADAPAKPSLLPRR